MTNPVRRSKMRPARPLSPILVALLALLIWWVVAHNSGSGWVQALGDCVFGVIAVGLIGPALALARLDVEVLHAPSDAAAGMPAIVRLAVSGRARVRPIEPPGPDAFLGPRRGHLDDQMTVLPLHRGCLGLLKVEIATAAPFGIQWWSRRVLLELPSELHVAPRLGRPLPLPRSVEERTGAYGSPKAAEAGDARGVRDYRPGDRRRRVHWGTSAHTGRLMVREMEESSSLPVTVNVILPHESDAAERQAERALGTVVQLIDRGAHVLLATVEPSGTVVREVPNRREAGRRLARAVSGGGPPALEIRP